MTKTKRAPLPNVHLTHEQFDALCIVLGAIPGGEMWVRNERSLYAVCQSCGARDQQIMMRTHRRTCLWVAYGKAREIVSAFMLEEAVRKFK